MANSNKKENSSAANFLFNSYKTVENMPYSQRWNHTKQLESCGKCCKVFSTQNDIKFFPHRCCWWSTKYIVHSPVTDWMYKLIK